MEHLDLLLNEVTAIKERVDNLWIMLHKTKEESAHPNVSFNIENVVKAVSSMPVEKTIFLNINNDALLESYLTMLFSVACIDLDMKEQGVKSIMAYPCRIAEGFNMAQKVPRILKKAMQLTEKDIDKHIRQIGKETKYSFLADCFITCYGHKNNKQLIYLADLISLMKFSIADVKRILEFSEAAIPRIAFQGAILEGVPSSALSDWDNIR